MRRSEHHAVFYVVTRFGKQEEVVLGNQKILEKPGSLFWLSIDPTSNTMRLHQPDKQSNPCAAKTHKLTICSIRPITLFTPTFTPSRHVSHIYTEYTIQKQTRAGSGELACTEISEICA